jgi:glycosyltransferase involved in cell wall biosynthesis
MRILYHSPSNTIGGAELSLLETIKFMNGKGHQIYMALPFSEKSAYINLIEPYCEEILFVKPMNFFVSSKKKVSFQKSFIRYIYSSYKSGWHIIPVIKMYLLIKKNKIQLVHTNTVFSIDAALAAKLAGLPHCLHIREITGAAKDATLKLFFQGTLFFKYLMDKLCDIIICNSNYTLNSNRKYFPESKMQVLYNPIQPLNLLKIKKNSDFLVFGCVANVTANWKNHQLAIRLIKSIIDKNSEKSIILNIYGTIPSENDDYYQIIKSLIIELGLIDKVYFKGSHSQTLIYNEIDFLIHPTPFEPFGRVIIEAMANHILVIGINEGGAKELISNKKTGILVSEQLLEEEILEITNTLNDDKKRTRIQDEAFLFSKNFHPEIILNQLEKLYFSLNKNPLV